MNTYKNNRTAVVGDPVIAFSLSRRMVFVGILVGISAAAENCDARVMVIEPKKEGEVAGNIITHSEMQPDGNKRTDNYIPVLEHFNLCDLVHAQDAGNSDVAFTELQKEAKALSDALQGTRRELEEIKSNGGSAPANVPAFMRAKLRVSEVAQHGDCETVKMSPVCGKPFSTDGESEDNTFARWTPSGAVLLDITNPALIGKMKAEDTFYADFTLCDRETETKPTAQPAAAVPAIVNEAAAADVGAEPAKASVAAPVEPASGSAS